MSMLLIDHVENIEQIHTDGFKTNIKINFDLGDQIGDLRYEGKRENVKIVNVNKIVDV